MADAVNIKMRKPLQNLRLDEYIKKLKLKKYLQELELKKYINVFHKMRITRNVVKKIVFDLFEEEPVYIEKITNGNIYKVYKAILKSEMYLIIRISESSDKINEFLKEQWCTRKAMEAGVPASEILEVGNTIIPYPYMVVKEAYGIPGNKYEGDRKLMIEQLGRYCSIINKIPTAGYGKIFDWSHNVLSRNNTWKDFLEKEFHINEIMELYEESEVLTKENFKKLKKSVDKIKNWEFTPTLAHGDLLPKNVIVNKQGEIVTIIDWEASQSQNSIYWDLSTSLNNISEEERKLFVKGYGMTEKEFAEISPEIDSLYVLKKADMVKNHMVNNEPELLEKLKIKLNGVLNKY